MRGGPPTLYSSNQGYELLSLLSSSMSKSNKIPKTTTTPAPPQPVLWFPNNNADCGGSTKGSEEKFFLCPKVNFNFSGSESIGTFSILALLLSIFNIINVVASNVNNNNNRNNINDNSGDLNSADNTESNANR